MSNAVVSYTILAIDKASRVLTNVAKKTIGLGEATEQTNKKIIDSSQKVQSSIRKTSDGFRTSNSTIARYATAYAGFSFFKRMFQEGTQLQSTLAELEIVAGSSNMVAYKRDALAMSETYGKSAVDVVNVFRKIAAAKQELTKDPVLFRKVAEASIKLGIAGGVESVEAAGYLATISNMFKLTTAEQIESVAGASALSVQLGAAEVSSLIQTMIAGGSAASLNEMTPNTFLAISEGLAKSGLDSGVAGTEIAGVINRLLTQANWNPKDLPLLDAISELVVASKRGDLSSLEMLKLSGAYHAKGFGAMMSNIDFIKSTEATLNAPGRGAMALNDAVKIKLNTTESKINRVKEKILHKMVEVYDKSEPVLLLLIEKFSTMLDGISSEDINKAADAMKTLGLAIYTVLNIIEFFAPLIRMIAAIHGTDLIIPAGLVASAALINAGGGISLAGAVGGAATLASPVPISLKAAAIVGLLGTGIFRAMIDDAAEEFKLRTEMEKTNSDFFKQVLKIDVNDPSGLLKGYSLTTQSPERTITTQKTLSTRYPSKSGYTP